MGLKYSSVVHLPQAYLVLASRIQFLTDCCTEGFSFPWPLARGRPHFLATWASQTCRLGPQKSLLTGQKSQFL